jgi:hypothetical protein
MIIFETCRYLDFLDGRVLLGDVGHKRNRAFDVVFPHTKRPGHARMYVMHECILCTHVYVCAMAQSLKDHRHENTAC